MEVDPSITSKFTILKMVMKRYLFLLLLGALASCERDNLSEDGSGAYGPGRMIEIAPVAEQTEDRVVSRGTPITDASQMTDIGVYCSYTGATDWNASSVLGKMFNTRLVRNTTSGRWEYSGGGVNWGANNGNDRYSFFAYAPYATSQNGITVQGSAATAGIPSLSYTVPTNAVSQPDLMFAVPRYNLRPSTSMVSLQMKHALTCVGFQVQGNGEKVKSLALSGIYSSGQASINGSTIAWTPTGTRASFSPLLNYDADKSYYTATPTMSTNLLPGNGYLMMIPQTLDASALLTITFADNTTRSLCISGEWIAGKKVTYNIIITEQGIITLTPGTLLIPQLGVGPLTENISLTCSPANLNWSITTSAPWMKLTTNMSGSGALQTISGTGAATIYTVADANLLATERTATIYVQGRCPQVPLSTVTQLKYINPSTGVASGTPFTDVKAYVGAFWRASQVGERIIRIPIGANAGNAGEWTASVIWQDSNWALGDILFSTTPTLDPGVSFSLLDPVPADAEGYKVLDNKTVVTGTVAAGGVIYFRIGLRSAFTPTAATPARYAVVALSYKGGAKTHLIFVRQGEGADYLMRPTDAATGTFVSATRPLARKFMCYNLTGASSGTLLGGTLITDHPVVTLSGGAIAEFPSQAGSMFQWAVTDQLPRAIHPVSPEVLPIIGWSNNASQSYWTAGSPSLAQQREVCPAGYRRVSDGAENVASDAKASQSELRQSLLASLLDGRTPSNNNTVTGYYADGFFDRRCLVSSTGSFVGTTVSFLTGLLDLKNAKVAYIGTLFYNPNNWASLFFPSAGGRPGATLTPGVPIGNAGQYGFYWCSSGSTTTNNAYAMITGATNIRVIMGQDFNRVNALSIRCVKVP